MAKPSCSDDEFIALFKEHGPAHTAKSLGIDVRNVYTRKKRLERDGHFLPHPRDNYDIDQYSKRIPLKIDNGIVIIGSDAHYWPNIISTAHRGLVHLIEEMQPEAVILNGDVHDGATNGRHPEMGWKKKPNVNQELEAIQERLEEIRESAKKAERYWLLGNHCMRFDARLAQQNSMYDGVKGMSLPDHFPHWKFGISLWINGGEAVIKHRYKGGVHATHNNTVNAGKTIVTGHLHSLKVTPFDDYNGTRWGVDTGTLADPYGPQFDYTEDNPLNHRSGFIVLTFKKGRLLWPEICRVSDRDHIEFRGQVIRV